MHTAVTKGTSSRGLIEDRISEHGIGHHDSIQQETKWIHQCGTVVSEFLKPIIIIKIINTFYWNVIYICVNDEVRYCEFI